MTPNKVIVLGFDGVDPKVVREMISAGDLPNLEALSKEGTLDALGTTNPAESPVSWAAFTVGANPGHTGIFDFLHRVPETYIPDIALVKREQVDIHGSIPKVSLGSGLTVGLIVLLLLMKIRSQWTFEKQSMWAGLFALMMGFLVAGMMTSWLPPSITVPELARDGTPFWKTVGDHGQCCSVLQVPVTFPAKGFPRGRLLTGLGTPDIRQTWGSYSVYTETTERDPIDAGNRLAEGELDDGFADSVTGGKIYKIGFPPTGSNTVTTTLLGPPDVMGGPGSPPKRLDLRIQRDLEKREARFFCDGLEVSASEGNWTDFLEVEFGFSPILKAKGIVRFMVRSVEPFYAYASPINLHPESPPFVAPISAPRGFSAEVVENTGDIFETVGWAIATNPLKDEWIDEEEFLQDLNFTFEKRWKIVQSELKKDDWKVLVAVLLAPDRVQHMFWRHRDPKHPLHDPAAPPHHVSAIADVYRRMDQMIGEVMEQHVDEETDLYILSDHGFASYRKSVHINSWLIEEGYLVLENPQSRLRGNLANIFAGLPFANVDWSRTRAYSFGLGKIYLNRQGREPGGIVTPAEAPGLLDEIARKFEGLTDPETGEPVVRKVYKALEIYSGPHAEEAGDLIIGFEEGYRVSWDTAAGNFPEGIIEPNLNKWSGDHCSVDPSIVPGFIASNRKLDPAGASVIDLAPTVLKRLNIPVPEQMEGRSIFVAE